MRKSCKKWMLAALLVACTGSILAFTSCGKDKGEDSSPSNSAPSQPGTDVTVSDFELSKNNAEMVLGDELLLVAIYDKTEDTPVVWTSSNPSIASITQEGIVTANDVGEATITAAYGEYSATCKINVGLGDLQPVLVLKSYLGEEIVPFTVGTGYALNAVVQFNGKEYACEPIVTIDGSDTIVYEDGKINATAEGIATVNVSTVWKGVDTALLTTQIRVEALASVFITPFVTYKGTNDAIATNDIELSMVDEWCGKEYVNAAKVEFKALISGVESVLTDVSIVEGSDLITYDEATGEIVTIPNRRGIAKVGATYQSNGKDYVRTLYVNVTCPVEEYTGLLELDTSKNFPTAQFFGSGATIKEAYQGDADISPAPGRSQLIGVTENGYNTEEILVYSSRGAYLFTNIFCYSMKLTQSNFLSALSLADKIGPIEGYYVLSENVTVDTTSQISGDTNKYFAATFDGCNFTVNATVDDTGIFGHVGGDARIINTHFNFTFKTGCYAVGLAKNSAMGTMELAAAGRLDTLDICLENLYVTSTNYTATSYTLMGEAPWFLTMKDVYVNVNVGSATTGARSEKAALFHMDRALYNSLPAGQHHLNAYKNVYVVTGALVPMADYATKNSAGHPYAFTTWADNDIDNIGAVRRATSASSAEYMKLKPSSESEEHLAEYGKYYTYDGHVKHPPKGACMAWTYIGIARYNTVANVLSAGVTKIGSWTVA